VNKNEGDNTFKRGVYYTAQCANNLKITITRAVRKRRILIATAVMELQRTQKKRDYKKKQYWVAPYLKDRQKYSFFHVSIPKLTLEDGIRYHNYFRMSATQLEELLLLVGAQLQKINAVRECIEPKKNAWR